MKCPECSSVNLTTYRHLNAEILCADCGFVVRNEGSSHNNTPKDNLLQDLTELLGAAQSLRTYREGSDYYKDAERTVVRLLSRYEGE